MNPFISYTKNVSVREKRLEELSEDHKIKLLEQKIIFLDILPVANKEDVLIKKIKNRFYIEKPRPLVGYSFINLPNFVAVFEKQNLDKNNDEKFILKVKLKTHVLVFYSIFSVIILYLFITAFTDEAYLGIITILFPLFAYLELSREKAKFIEFINSLLNLDLLK